MPYIELQVTSNFSFLEGASHPEELANTCIELGHAAFAITDRNSLAGIVRAYEVAKRTERQLLVGARLDLTDGASLLCYPMDRAAYGRLCRLLTLGKRCAPKGQCHLSRADLAAHAEGQILVALAPEGWGEGFAAELRDWVRHCPGRVYLAGHHLFRGDDAARLERLDVLAVSTGAPLVAANDVLYHHPARRPLHDVLACIKDGVRLAEAVWRLLANAERYPKPPAEMARLFARHPDAIARTTEIAERCRFSLKELRYEYPEEASEGYPPQERLVQLAWEGAARFWPGGVSEKVRKALDHELALIAQLDYAPYFLTVADIVRFARSKEILCQGRGSAANSAVCYCLGITAVDPGQSDLLFERFLSAERGEPPDIDVDFEHERREEVIQHIYEKYGRERAGLAATVIHYRRRSALREVGKVMGLSEDAIVALTGTTSFTGHHGGRDGPAAKKGPHPDPADSLPCEAGDGGVGASPFNPAHIREAGLDPASPAIARTLALAGELVGFPRHLSQHVGGFVISRGRLDELVPIENAAMKDRTVISWDKDDLEALGLMKVDVLALGMLSCLQKGFDLLACHKGQRLELATIPQEDAATYDMLCKADSVGVFQVESRAQMSMLPRLKPRTFYDLVIEVAIVRPGPIQGGMVHPYLQRRNRPDQVRYPSPELEAVLKKTLGVPLFQEQAMKIAMVGAGFTAAQADGLRRAMATFRHSGDIPKFRAQFMQGMRKNGYTGEFAERVFDQIEGFGDYGFPESHAASFALLAYASAWMKCHHPEIFACALLNSQPMGFYQPAQLVRDAREHGVEVRPVDINHSDWDCSLEALAEPPPEPSPACGGGSLLCGFPPPFTGEGQGGGRFALRLGLRQTGLSEKEGEFLMKARLPGYESVHALWRRGGLGRDSLERLADADAFGSIGLIRRQALWAVRALGSAPPPLLALAAPREEAQASLPLAGLGEEVVADYAATGLSLKSHPLALLRAELAPLGIVPASRLQKRSTGRIALAGLVLNRQRPGTANGVVFMTLEDETGIANIVIWPDVFTRYRVAALAGSLLRIDGRIQREGLVIHVIAEKIANLTARLTRLGTPGAAPARYPSRDFQ